MEIGERGRIWPFQYRDNEVSKGEKVRSDEGAKRSDDESKCEDETTIW